ncbi:MAG TPA: pilus assembly protein TadG-related protein [Chloroflexota bacterium]
MQVEEHAPAESGQALLYFAMVLPVLIFCITLVIGGSYVMNEYRHMQTAADMAALVGAQALPCEITDIACISAAERRACTYAQDNGYSGCTPHASSGTSANVPPLSCSPYDFVNYGNASSNPKCKASSAPLSNYAFIEVRLYLPIKIPFFGGTATTLYAHAVARHGQVSPKRFAVIVLDPTMSKALTLSGSQGGGLVAVGPIVSDSTAADSIYTGGQSTDIACSGQWYTAANEVVPPLGPAANLTSNTGGTTWFAPPICSGGSLDSPTRFLTSQPSVPDPYAGSVPPSASNMSSNCTPCGQTAWYYTWTTGLRRLGTWHTSDQLPNNITNGNNYEFFPGIYTKSISISGGNIYFNPGVYTLKAGMSQTGGSMCIYGAPACDAQINTVNALDNCSNASFRSGDLVDVDSGSWYYYCSPWGVWDTTLAASSSGNEPTTPPTFLHGGPLNGVTFYLQSGSLSMNGNGADYLAFPNPCPGTGNLNGSGQKVLFPDGSATGSYTYPITSLPFLDGVTSSPTNGQVYPSADMGFGAECDQAQPPNPQNVWSGELVGQHLHFLIYAPYNGTSYTSISLNGTGLQNWWGIVYDPGQPGCGTSCTVSINGSGGGGKGPPLLSGQVIADNASFSGNAAFEIFYSPCRPDGDVCSIGYGTSLVE